MSRERRVDRISDHLRKPRASFISSFTGISSRILKVALPPPKALAPSQNHSQHHHQTMAKISKEPNVQNWSTQ